MLLHSRRISFTVAILASLAAFFLTSCGAPGSAAGGSKPKVLCTIFCYYDAARAIAGDKAQVTILLGPSKSPHEYETTTRDKIVASSADLYIKNGLGLDDHFDKLLDGSKARILDISRQIPKEMLVTTEELSLDAPATKADVHENVQVVQNPHIWLDPLVQIKAAEIIRDALIELDPSGKATFQQNAAAYIEDIKKLDSEIKAAAATFRTRDFIGFHSAYDYLAHRYGLRQIASIEEIPGSDITIAQTQKIIQLIKDRHIRFIAVETAFSGEGAKLILNETGAQQIVLQPLETYDNPSDTYAGLMRKNLEALKTALGG